MLNEWVTQALIAADLTQAEMGRRLTEMLGRSIDHAAVNKMKLGKRKVSADEMLAIARIAGIDPPKANDSPDTVPLIGYVGAGAEALLYSEGQGPFDEVPAPPSATNKTVSVEIRGTSLGELFDTWLVYYDNVRDPPGGTQLGKLCVCGLADGRILVKKLKRGQIKDHFTLLSNTEPPIYDVIVNWAAIVTNMTPR